MNVFAVGPLPFYVHLAFIWCHPRDEWHQAFPELLPFRLCVMLIFQTSNSHKCMGVNREALQLHSVRIFYCKSHENLYQYYKSRKNPYLYYKSHENLYQLLQVMRAVSECAMIHMIKSLSPQYQAIPEKTSLVCCRWHWIQMATNSYFSV